MTPPSDALYGRFVGANRLKVFGLPVAPEPTEASNTDLPSVEPPPPDVDISDTTPPEITPDQSNG